MLQIKPDISFPVQYLSRGLQSPTTTHLNAAKNLLRYLNGTRDLAICYRRNSSNRSFDLLVPIGYNNNNFAGDKITNKSIFGYLFTIANGPIS